MKVLVTGAAGFIGFHLSKRLIDEGHDVIGLDNINAYYDINLKYARLHELGIDNNSDLASGRLIESNLYHSSFKFIKMNLESKDTLDVLFDNERFDVVCNLAAQAGVRYSIKNPQAYIDSNIQGFLNILENCRNHQIKRLVYASSSSVYGNSDMVPFSEHQNVDAPISLYAATKKSNELMAYTYSHLYNFETIGLRFFTVYGPWGRPDMAMYLFTDAIINNQPVKVFNNGNLSRDFTYIDDIIDGVTATITKNAKVASFYQLYNIGNSQPVKLNDFISEIEKNIGKKAIKRMMPMQDGDVNQTWADVKKLKDNYDYYPKTTVEKGVLNFVEWYKSYYK